MTDIPVELEASLRARAAAFDKAGEDGSAADTFSFARSYEGDDPHTAYGDVILARVAMVGALEAACEDLGNAVGFPSYDDALPGLHAIRRQWDGVADAYDVLDPAAIEVRTAAEQLREELAKGELDRRVLAHLVARAAAQEKLLELALRLADADDKHEFWGRYRTVALRLWGAVHGTSAELIGWGLLDLDLDEVLEG